MNPVQSAMLQVVLASHGCPTCHKTARYSSTSRQVCQQRPGLSTPSCWNTERWLWGVAKNMDATHCINSSVCLCRTVRKVAAKAMVRLTLPTCSMTRRVSATSATLTENRSKPNTPPAVTMLRQKVAPKAMPLPVVVVLSHAKPLPKQHGWVRPRDARLTPHGMTTHRQRLTTLHPSPTNENTIQP